MMAIASGTYLIRAGETYRIITDHLGSPRLIVNTNTGEVAQRIGEQALAADREEMAKLKQASDAKVAEAKAIDRKHIVAGDRR